MYKRILNEQACFIAYVLHKHAILYIFTLQTFQFYKNHSLYSKQSCRLI